MPNKRPAAGRGAGGSAKVAKTAGTTPENAGRQMQLFVSTNVDLHFVAVCYSNDTLDQLKGARPRCSALLTGGGVLLHSARPCAP